VVDSGAPAKPAADGWNVSANKTLSTPAQRHASRTQTSGQVESEEAGS